MNNACVRITNKYDMIHFFKLWMLTHYGKGQTSTSFFRKEKLWLCCVTYFMGFVQAIQEMCLKLIIIKKSSINVNR